MGGKTQEFEHPLLGSRVHTRSQRLQLQPQGSLEYLTRQYGTLRLLTCHPVFEAAGAAACLITDYWIGIEEFFDPNREILVAHDGNEVVEWMRRLSSERAQEVGAAACRRVLAEHTYAHRAAQVDCVLDTRTVASAGFA
jgi:hypothetical protein